MIKQHVLFFICGSMFLGGCAQSLSQGGRSSQEFGTNMAALAAAPMPNDVPDEIFVESPPLIDDSAGNEIGIFKTDFKKATKSRAHNIAMASNAIDETVVAPGAVFSFNEAVGPTTKGNGFMLGRIFVKGKDSKGYGGGVCQVSSTLYNAVLDAGLEVTEHHTHSKAVNYVDIGKDAATSYGVLDFQFTNNKPYPVRINSFVGKEENITVVLMAL